MSEAWLKSINQPNPSGFLRMLIAASLPRENTTNAPPPKICRSQGPSSRCGDIGSGYDDVWTGGAGGAGGIGGAELEPWVKSSTSGIRLEHRAIARAVRSACAATCSRLTLSSTNFPHLVSRGIGASCRGQQ